MEFRRVLFRSYRRMNRPNDFRASGSGNPSYQPDRIDKRCLQIAFRVAEQLATQSLAFDFLFGPQQDPMIGEISYCYVASMVHACEGFWNHQGAWQEGHVWPEHAIIEDLILALSLCGKGQVAQEAMGAPHSSFNSSV